MLSADGFEKAIVGVCLDTVGREKPVLVYDFEKCVKIVMSWKGIENEIDALDYVNFNLLNQHLGDQSPLFIRRHKTLEEIEQYDYEE
jgi:hypothetical protein